MNITVKSFVVSLFILFLFIGYQSQQIAESNESQKHVCTACEKGQAGETIWCDSCNAGFVKGNKVNCKSCFDGKSGENVWCQSCNVGYINSDKIECKGCFDAKINGTTCEICQK